MVNLIRCPGLRVPLLIFFVACAPEGADLWGQQRLDKKPLDSRRFDELIADDLDAIASHPAVQNNDPQKNRAFAEVFGGNTGKDVRRFLDERLHHYITLDDYEILQHGVEITPVARAWAAIDTPPYAQRAETIARNVGAELFLLGVREGFRVSLPLGRQMVPVCSSRVGIMAAGPGYRHSFFDDSGHYTNLGSLIRQASMVHEARHSDCPNGISRKGLKGLFAAMGSTDARVREAAHRSFPSESECTQAHIMCSDGDYKGLYACDLKPFQCYSVQLIFYDTLTEHLDPTDPQKQAAGLLMTDLRSRLAFDWRDMYSGRLGVPNLSHSDRVLP